MTTEKTIALTRWTFVGKVMSLLFNMLSRFNMLTFLPRSRCLLISWLQSPSAVIWSPPKWSLTLFPLLCQHQNQIDYILCSQRWRSSIQSAKTRPGADCGSDHQLFIARFRLKLKKVGKTTKSFRYDLNQIPYDYTVEMTNRFKRLNLIDRVPKELWMEGGLWHCTEGRDQDHPQEKEMQKSKMAVWGSLTNSCEKKRSKRQRRKGNTDRKSVV